ncbi:MAG TPA: NAD(P)/FAD-dependent oxidoreductase [Candidatus Baltobacteraceae bacterium]|nr:NAD(P)/FAD-dependent oxidoreductase [Candidatus Baltobacteraceae bacterium]
MERYDGVEIVGAGLVGLSLARELAQSGIEVTVYDGKRRVSDGAAKASGIFSATGLERIGVPYRSSMVNTLSGATLHAGKETLRIKAKAVQAYVVDRGLLAEAAMREAERAGAKIVLNNRLDRNRLLQGAGSGKIIVGADGAVSTVASAFGFPDIREYILTYKAEYDVKRIEDKHMVGLYFDNKIAHRFFGWTVPYSDSRVEVGIGISDRAKITSLMAFKRFVASGGITELEDGGKMANGYASLIPLTSRRKTVIGNVALVGDAAGQVKATTGGGIIFGVSCAKLLAHQIKRTMEGKGRLEEYDAMWRKRYGIDLKMHAVVHRYYATMDSGTLGLFMKMSKLFGSEQFFSKYGDMDRPSLMLKRFFLRGLAK